MRLVLDKAMPLQIGHKPNAAEVGQQKRLRHAMPTRPNFGRYGRVGAECATQEVQNGAVLLMNRNGHVTLRMGKPPIRKQEAECVCLFLGVEVGKKVVFDGVSAHDRV